MYNIMNDSMYAVSTKGTNIFAQVFQVLSFLYSIYTNTYSYILKTLVLMIGSYSLGEYDNLL